MSDLIQAIALGIIQGLTEFLPISSTAHLVLARWGFGWHGGLVDSLTFDVALHIGTLAAVLGYFFGDWVKLAGGLGRSIGRRAAPDDPWPRLAFLLVAGTVPAALGGAVFESTIERTVRSPYVIGITLIVFALLLAFADRAGRRERPLERLGLVDALAIGLAQAVAMVPGVSRSGATMTVGLLAGLTREAAARFSFLLSTPIVALAAAKKVWDLRAAPPDDAGWATLVTGALVSGVVGYLCIRWLLGYVRRASFALFIWYRLVLGAVVLLLTYGRLLQ